jgi:hypothetical protein
MDTAQERQRARMLADKLEAATGLARPHRARIRELETLIAAARRDIELERRAIEAAFAAYHDLLMHDE